MKNEITRYRNEVNSIPMRKWSIEEMNFFFAILTKLRDEGTREINFGKHELADLAKYTITHNKRYEKTIEQLGKHVSGLQYWEKTNNSFMSMPLFTKFKATWSDDLTKLDVSVKANEEFEYILNSWNEGNWTQFMLEEFTEIQSTYSKTLFRLLKQWRTIGAREFSLNELKHLLDIPDSYSAGMVNKRVVNNSVEDLKPYFENLKVKVLKSNARGTPIIGFKFTWKPEKTENWEKNKYKKISKKKGFLPDWAMEEKEFQETTSKEKLKKLRKEHHKKLKKFEKLKK
ncbi:MAG: replication initiation protein [Lactococcus lactis]|nr:replication initiation protein [Lactococcus lactis]MDN6389703.1 replication initiation protein [Lactococcus lactis]